VNKAHTITNYWWFFFLIAFLFLLDLPGRSFAITSDPEIEIRFIRLTGDNLLKFKDGTIRISSPPKRLILVQNMLTQQLLHELDPKYWEKEGGQFIRSATLLLVSNISDHQIERLDFPNAEFGVIFHDFSPQESAAFVVKIERKLGRPVEIESLSPLLVKGKYIRFSLTSQDVEIPEDAPVLPFGYTPISLETVTDGQAVAADKYSIIKMPINIHGSVYAFLSEGDQESPSYGLYSYVLFPHPSPRAKTFINNLFERTGAANESIITPECLNIVYLPVRKDETTKQMLQQYGMRPPTDRFLDAMYAYNQARFMLSKICQGATDEISEICRGDLSQGPYLFTYVSPASQLSDLPPPLLFADLSKVPEEAFAEYISAYKAQVKRGVQFSDRERIDSFRLRLLEAILAASGLMEYANEIVHFVKE
jgi:hypothetical protein